MHRLRLHLRKVSLAGIEPVGFRVKSDLRNHQAIVQPRLYDSLMVTQITLRCLSVESALHVPEGKSAAPKGAWQCRQEGGLKPGLG